MLRLATRSKEEDLTNERVGSLSCLSLENTRGSSCRSHSLRESSDRLEMHSRERGGARLSELASRSRRSGECPYCS